MNILDLIQAISAGICFYAGITHLILGLRSTPRDRLHLSFALVSLLVGAVSVAIFVLYAAVETGSLAVYLIADKWSIAVWYLALPALFWFIAFYTGSARGRVLWVITALYVAIALSNFVLPGTWVYTDIKLNPTFPPDIVVAPWYSAEQVITWVLILGYSAVQISRQFRRGEREAATILSIALGIFLISVLWDYAIEYGLINAVLMQQYGFVAFIVVMSVRLSGQLVETEQEVQRLNIELADRVEERTFELRQRTMELQGRVEELSAINRVAEMVATTSDLEEMLANAGELATRMFSSKVTFISVRGSETSELQLLAVVAQGQRLTSIDNRTLPLQNMPIAERVLRTGKTEIATDLRAVTMPESVRSLIDRFNIGSTLNVPLKSQGEVFGILTLGDGDPQRRFSESQITLAETIAGSIAGAIQNARLAEQAQAAAVDAERQRLARELHDSVTQSLYSLTLLSNGWKSMAEQGTLEDPAVALGRLGEVGQQALREMRLLIHQLRPPTLESLGLIQALQKRLDAVEQRANVDSRLITTGAVDSLPRVLEDQLFYIAQEALNNSLRHSSTVEVIVHVEVNNKDVSLSVKDFGSGFDPDKVTGGMGLTHMAERAEFVGGSLEIVSVLNRGTEVHVVVPQERHDDE